MARAMKVAIVDDEADMRASISQWLALSGFDTETFPSAEEALKAIGPEFPGVVVSDIKMPGMDGMAFLKRLMGMDSGLPVILITGHGDVPMAVEAMRHGALDFLRKPVNEESFLERIAYAFDQESGDWRQKLDRDQARQRIDSLTEREHEVFLLVAEGLANKAIASDLGISERTVEVHRSQVMKKLGAKTLAQLVRIYLQSE